MSDFAFIESCKQVWVFCKYANTATCSGVRLWLIRGIIKVGSHGNFCFSYISLFLYKLQASLSVL